MGSPTFDWGYTFSLFTEHALWRAALVVIALAALSWTIGTALGMGIALARQSRWHVARKVAGAYVWFFRSMPLLVLIIFVYNTPQVVPALHALLANPFWAGLIAIVLSETAYISEIHRGGLMSVGPDQRDAARALGIPYSSMTRRIVIPQAFRIALPALGNEFVSILKLTSLVSVISLAEILLTGQRLYTQNFKVLETLFAVSIYYVALVSVFDVLQRSLERWLDVSQRRTELAAESSSEHIDARDAVSTERERHSHTGTAVVEARDVHKQFGASQVLKGVDLDVHAGEVVAIVGPSGSGKTTLLRTLNHLEPFDAGSVMVDGTPMGYRIGKAGEVQTVRDSQLALQRRQVGMVFQRFNLFPHLTVMQNLTLAPRIAALDNGEETLEESARGLLRKVGMERHVDRYPHQLSGGQQQRVAIARALAMRPRVLLFDEPTSALDHELVGEVLKTMTELAAEGVTMVVVTHEMRFVRQVADWVVFMDGGQVVEQGPPSVLFNEPREERTRRFFQSQLEREPVS